MRYCVVGAGAVGSMLADLARSGGDTVTVIDRADGAAGMVGDVVLGDVTAPAPQVCAVLAASDTVILALPEAVAVAAAPTLDRIMRPGALLVETLSVKARVHVVTRVLGRPAVGINPMFAPALGMTGRPVAAVVHRDGPAVDRFLGAVAGWGGRVVRLGAGEHDRITATTQALTHAVVLAFGLALAESGIAADGGMDRVAATAPPPHTTLLALLARIGSGAAEVYHDVQAGNPEAAGARKALAAGLSRLSETVERGDEDAFARVMADAVAPLGDRRDDYRALCADLFAQVPREGGPR